MAEIIDFIGDAIVRNLAVMLPLSLIFVKLLLIRLSGNKPHQWKVMLAIPEDLSYIALGFVVAGISGTLTSFNDYFKGSEHVKLDIVLLAMCSSVVCYAVHLIDQHLTLPNYTGWRAADDVLDKKITPAQAKKAANLAVRDKDFANIFWWKFLLFLLGIVIELVITGLWLFYVTEIVEHRY